MERIKEILTLTYGSINRQVFIYEPSSMPDKQETIASPYYNAKEASDYLGITVRQLYGYIERRRIKPLKGTGRLRFTKQQLDAFIAKEKNNG